MRLDNCEIVDSAAKFGGQRHESENTQRLKSRRIVHAGKVFGKKDNF